MWEKAGGETDKAVPHIDLSPLSEHPPVQSAEVFIIAMNDATSNTHYFKNKPFQAILLFITTLVYFNIENILQHTTVGQRGPVVWLQEFP